MPAQLHLITSGNMSIKLDGLQTGHHINDPAKNVKMFEALPNSITLHAIDQNNFTDWAVIELNDLQPGQGSLAVTIDSPTFGWYGTAQLAVVINGQVVLSDNFQSGVRGIIGDPRCTKRYAIMDFH